jgi:hypothetical protein
MTGLHRWYLQGRDDADEDLDLEQFDAETLARRVLSGTPIRDLTVTAMTDLLAIDPHDGSEREWVEEHAEDLEEDEVDPAAAYKEWRRGWIDEGAHQLEAEIVEAMQELLDELDQSDGEGATYEDWRRTGAQDCGNAWSVDDDVEAGDRKLLRRPGVNVDAEIKTLLDGYWEIEREDAFKEWSRQNAKDVKADDLEPERAFEEWVFGFRSCQEKMLRAYAAR